MKITAMELEKNVSKYHMLARTEDIWVTLNGILTAKIVAPNVSSVDFLSGLLAEKISDKIDRHSIHEERILSKYAIND